MQLAFDPRDRNQAVHVLALIEALHPDMAGISSVDAAAVGAIAAQADEAAPDPATAFAGQSAEQAFAPPPPVAGAAPPAPPASPAPTTAAATTPTPAPAASPPATPASTVETDKEGLPWDKRIHSTPAKINKSDGLWRAKKNLDAAERERVVAELRQVMAAPVPSQAAPASDGAPPAPVSGATESTTAPTAPPPMPAAAGTASGQADATPAPSAPPPPPPVPAAPPAPAHDPLATAIADGWTPHPDSAGRYYKGQEVLSETDMTARYPAPAAAAPPPVPITAPAAAPATDFASLMRKITGMQTAGHLTVEQTTQISQSLGITGVRDLMHRPDLIPAFDAALPVAA